MSFLNIIIIDQHHGYNGIRWFSWKINGSEILPCLEARETLAFGAGAQIGIVVTIWVLYTYTRQVLVRRQVLSSPFRSGAQIPYRYWCTGSRAQ